MKPFISIIIPNYDGGKTIGQCLGSILQVEDNDREVIVVDDGSRDDSLAIIGKYPCRLISLERHAGASAARNAGAAVSKGDVLFFIDADCLLQPDTLTIIRQARADRLPSVVIGGTYTPEPYDPGFFNRFQSIFINYSETKNSNRPDYIATHALVIPTVIFRAIGGFRENFLPILEDVEFSHRLRRAGYVLQMDPKLQVRHIFNFSFLKSLRNAARKSRYWIVYSLTNRDLLADSGTASAEIKVNGMNWVASVLLAICSLGSGNRGFLAPLPLLWAFNLFLNRYLFRAFYHAGGVPFAFLAAMYYSTVYPGAIWAGVVRGVIQFATRTGPWLSREDDEQTTLPASSKEP